MNEVVDGTKRSNGRRYDELRAIWAYLRSVPARQFGYR